MSAACPASRPAVRPRPGGVSAQLSRPQGLTHGLTHSFPLSFPLSRRDFLVLAGIAALGSVGIGSAAAAPAARNAGAFKARSWETAYAALGLPGTQWYMPL